MICTPTWVPGAARYPRTLPPFGWNATSSRHLEVHCVGWIKEYMGPVVVADLKQYLMGGDICPPFWRSPFNSSTALNSVEDGATPTSQIIKAKLSGRRTMWQQHQDPIRTKHQPSTDSSSSSKAMKWHKPVFKTCNFHGFYLLLWINLEKPKYIILKN